MRKRQGSCPWLDRGFPPGSAEIPPVSLSVVIPCRNGARFLAQTLRAALNQTRPPDEIVVVDDGSTDASRAIAEAFGPPVRVLSGPAEGAAVARNAGAAAATGDLLMFLDADDLLTPPTLAALAAALAGQGRAVALCPWDRYELAGEAWIARRPLGGAQAAGAGPARGLAHRALLAALRRALDARGVRGLGRLAAGGGARRRRQPDAPGAGPRHPRPLGARRASPSTGGCRASCSPTRPSCASPSACARARPRSTDTVAELERAGRLARYRAPLAEALAILARDAAGTEFAGEVAALAARAGAAPPGLALRRRTGAFRARLAARRAEWRTPPAPPLAAAPRAAPDGPLPVAGPLVSVVIPTFNRAALVARAAESVLAQTWRDLELIVVDDGSTDGTAERLAADRRPAPAGRRRRTNGGVARARNRGLAEARGGWIAFLDSDDLWRPEKLARQMAVMLPAPARMGFCHTGLEIVLPDGTAEAPATATGRIFEPCLLDNPVRAPTSSGLVRREVGRGGGRLRPRPAGDRGLGLAAADRAPLRRRGGARAARRLPRRGRGAAVEGFRANLDARAMLWRRNAHALRRAGLAHLYLIESARRELREPEGDPREGRALVLAALAEKPGHRPHHAWLPYMLAPYRLRARLRDIDAPRHARRVAAEDGP